MVPEEEAEIVEAEVGPENEAATHEDVKEEDPVEQTIPIDEGESTQEEESGKLDEM